MQLKKQFSKMGSVFKKSLSGFSDDKVTTLSASISYYTVFSVAPLLLIAIAVAGIFLGEEAVRGEIFGSIRGLVGDQGAAAIQSFVESASVTDGGTLATIIGVVTLLIGATGLFAQLQDSLNTIFKVKAKPHGGIWPLVRQRLLSLSLIVVIAFVLLVSLVVSAAIAGLSKYASQILPGSDFLWRIVDIVVSLSVTTVLFSAIYKILPDVKLRWRDVVTGAAITALLFTIGRVLIGLYIGRSSVSSSYGAAGSLVVVLLWTYYSSMILLFGAEYTRFNAYWDGKKPELKKNAVWMDVPEHLKGSPREKPKAA